MTQKLLKMIGLERSPRTNWRCLKNHDSAGRLRLLKSNVTKYNLAASTSPPETIHSRFAFHNEYQSRAGQQFISTHGRRGYKKTTKD